MSHNLFSAVLDLMEGEGSVGASSSAIASHGRHPNFTFLMGAPKTRAADRCAVTVHGETPSIAEKPYLYWFTGRKWPSSLHQKALCEAATCELSLVGASASARGGKSKKGGSTRLVCIRYEVVGSPVVLERYQLSNNENSLCRMFCSKNQPQEAHVGGAVAHLEGTSLAHIMSLFTDATVPILLPEAGHREASWCTFTSALDDERSSESCNSAHGQKAVTAPLTHAAVCSAALMDAPSMGRSSTSSSSAGGGGMSSTSATPITPQERRSTSSSTGHSPEPVLLAPLPLQCHQKSTAARTFHLSTISDIIERDELLQLYKRRSAQDPAAHAALEYHSLAVVRGWSFWRTSKPDDLQTLERRSVVHSMHEIMFSNNCSRNAYHLAVSLLDRYLAVTAAVLSNDICCPTLRVLMISPSSGGIRAAIACAISVATKTVDIYAPSLERLGMSLGSEIFSEASSYEVLELNFLRVLRFSVHPLTMEEVSETLLELWFGHSTQPHPSVGSPSPVMTTAARRAATLTRYLVDLVVRSATHTSLPPTYVGAAAVQYAVETIRSMDKLSPTDLLPMDQEGIQAFMTHVSEQDVTNQCFELLRRTHTTGRTRMIDFLEKQYHRVQTGVCARSCRTAFLEPLSMLMVPPPTEGNVHR